MGLIGSINRLLRLSCREAADLLSQAEDRRLGRVDRWALRGHLLVCAACRRYRRRLRDLREIVDGAVRRAVADEAGPGLSEEARGRLRDALD